MRAIEKLDRVRSTMAVNVLRSVLLISRIWRLVFQVFPSCRFPHQNSVYTPCVITKYAEHSHSLNLNLSSATQEIPVSCSIRFFIPAFTKYHSVSISNPLPSSSALNMSFFPFVSTCIPSNPFPSVFPQKCPLCVFSSPQYVPHVRYQMKECDVGSLCSMRLREERSLCDVSQILNERDQLADISLYRSIILKSIAEI